MHLKFTLSIFFIYTMLFSDILIGQTTTVSSFATILKSNHNLGLNSVCWNWNSPACPMTYEDSEIDAKGGAFTLHFTNQTSGPSKNLGSGYKGYPCGTVGGFKKGSNYYPGIPSVCGMPKKIGDLNHDVRIKWKVSQSNVDNENGITDKWFASLNVIFDDVVDGTTEPNDDARDYDLVIELDRFEQEDLNDKPKDGNEVYWKFARNGGPGSTLKTFDLHYGAETYKWAVRYKFFNYPIGVNHPNEDKNDKVHVKFISVDNNHVAPYIDHSLKLFINTSKNYLQHANLNTAEQTLADLKVAKDETWVKSISAGYEIYEGDFIIRNDYFYTVIDNTPPPVPANLTAIKNQTTVNLNWDDVNETSLEGYEVYRSVNGGSFQVIGTAYTSDYIDNDIISTNNYVYYIKAIDRSFNTSVASNTANLSSPLPIELTHFSANWVEKNKAQLKWETATEINNDYFAIERSFDAKNWTLVQKVAGKGNSNTPQYYTSFDDLTPQNIVYYRLKQVDMDGSFSYSKTVALDNSIKSTFVLYPNPSSDVLSIQFISKGAQTVDFKLVNMLGQTVQSHSYDTTEGDNQLNLNIFTLPKGQYIVSIKEGNLVTFKKFVKN